MFEKLVCTALPAYCVSDGDKNVPALVLIHVLFSFLFCVGSAQDYSRHARGKDAHPPRREADFRGYAEIDAFDITIHT